MSHLFEEIDCCLTPIGEQSLLRRRRELKLGDEFIMISLFTTASRRRSRRSGLSR